MQEPRSSPVPLIRHVLVLVEDNGQQQWYGGAMEDDCRTVLIGAEAYGAAGTHDRLPRSGLEQVPAPMMQRSAELRSADADQDATGTQAMALKLPPHCEYIGGRWYCW